MFNLFSPLFDIRQPAVTLSNLVLPITAAALTALINKLIKYGCLGLINLWGEHQEACQEVESASVGHADDNVSDSTVGQLVKKLVEESHHALCSFASITLHCGKLGGQEVVKFLQIGRENKEFNTVKLDMSNNSLHFLHRCPIENTYLHNAFISEHETESVFLKNKPQTVELDTFRI